jgi:energy-converting hydrogenase Eha subunit A
MVDYAIGYAIGMLIVTIIAFTFILPSAENEKNRKYCYELSIEKGISYDECMEFVDK